MVSTSYRQPEDRMGEVYWGFYAVTDHDANPLGEEQVCTPQSVIAPIPGDWFGVGNGWTAHATVLAQCLPVSGWQGGRYPRASDVARLAAAPPRRSAWVNADQALPVYLRNKIVSK